MTVSRSGPILLINADIDKSAIERMSDRVLKVASLLVKLEEQNYFGSVNINLGGEIKTIKTSQEIVI